MALSAQRIDRGHPTAYPWERKAIDQVLAALPDVDPIHAWELHELHDPTTGRLYEIDLLVLARHALYLVEVKSHPGVLTGDALDWTFTELGARPRTLANPYPATNHKARVLADLLERAIKPELRRSRPFIQPLVLLSQASSIQLDGGRPPWLVKSEEIVQVLTQGIPSIAPRQIVDNRIMREVVAAARRLGLRPAAASRVVGGYRLQHVVDEGEGYQEHSARHMSVDSDRARVRTWLVPQASSVERRQQLERAARREADVLARLGQHPGILRYRAFVEQGPLGPAVIFEDFDGGLPLHVFLKQEPELSFDDRLGLLQQIVEALAHCHRNDVIHRNLSPASVLARRNSDGALEIRLHRFQTAAVLEQSSLATRHHDQLAATLDRLYLAPEVLEDPDKATTAADIFSVGCLAWLLFVGQHPAPTLSERDRRLKEVRDGELRPRGLRPSVVRDDLSDLDEAIAEATHPIARYRADDVTAWYHTSFLDFFRHPVADSLASVDPRTAQPGDMLPHGLTVEKRLGSGATALVLKVVRDDRMAALKVPHDPGGAERMDLEAQVLGSLRHQNIVGLIEPLSFGPLKALLLEFAGDRTLADQLRQDGSLPLDLARRFGEELLSALVHLEEAGVTHRDIKPANMGFSAIAKKLPRLLLFDFSLASADATAVTAGTPEWRDPTLYLRGRWDAAADRYAAAAVLYAMLTGIRPERLEDGPTLVHVDAERFDAAVRDRLASFFTTAFLPETERRFLSADAMREAWLTLFAQTEQPAADEHRTQRAWDQARPETPVEALPLSARARNALDRAGVATVSNLLALPRNQLSVLRGVGRKVAEEILDAADELRDRLSITAPPPLVPDFPGPRVALDDPDLGLSAEARTRLREAGLTGSADLAASPLERVERLIGAASAQALRAQLVALAAAQPAPGTLADWVQALLGRRENEASKRGRVLCGVDPLPGFDDDAIPAARSVMQVSAALHTEPQRVHSSLQFLRQRWSEARAFQDLITTLDDLVSASGPVPLRELASTLVERRSVGQPQDTHAQRLAEALVRVAVEMRPDPPLAWRRLNGIPWVAKREADLDALAALAAEADTLANADSLPSTDTVRSRLLPLATGSPLADLPPDRLITLAARASATAAPSARLELYPRGMSAARALRLSQLALVGARLSPAELQSRVRARYPEAEPLPDRPALDGLLAPLGLIYSADRQEYLWPSTGEGSASGTIQQLRPATSSIQDLPQRRSPAEQRYQAFQDVLERGRRSRKFRAIQVAAPRADLATELLGQALGVRPISLDHALAQTIETEASALGVRAENIIAADRAGITGRDWDLLVALVQRAADRLVSHILAHREQPQLLVWPGAFARYRLSSALQRLIDGAEHQDGEAIFLLVPGHDDGLAPTINGTMPVPAPLAAQRLYLPEEWLKYRLRGAAEG